MSLLEGDHEVAAVIRVEMRSQRTDRAVRDLEMHLWTFDDSGRVTRLRHFLDTHQHVEAFAAP